MGDHFASEYDARTIAALRAENAALKADNAALLRDRLEMCPTCNGKGTYPAESPNGTEMVDVACPSCAYVRDTTHPGAALLERLSTMEASMQAMGEEAAKIDRLLSEAGVPRMDFVSERVGAMVDALRTLREEARTAFARGRDAGLEEAARVADAAAKAAMQRRNSINSNTPMGRAGYIAAEAQWDVLAPVAEDIRALKSTPAKDTAERVNEDGDTAKASAILALLGADGALPHVRPGSLPPQFLEALDTTRSRIRAALKALGHTDDSTASY